MTVPRALLGSVAVLLLAGSLAGCTTMANRDDEAAKIAALNQSWLALVARKDAQAIGKLYADDGAFLAPNAPIAMGPAAIAEAWAGLFKLPGLSLTFGTTRLEIAKSGDLASDRGTYELAFDSEKGQVRDTGKYVVVWKKVDGQWKVANDIFNSDGAP